MELSRNCKLWAGKRGGAPVDSYLAPTRKVQDCRANSVIRRIYAVGGGGLMGVGGLGWKARIGKRRGKAAVSGPKKWE